MGARNDIEMLSDACGLLLPAIQKAEFEAIAALQTSSSTVYVNVLRSCRVQRTIITIGMFSLLESTLQEEHGWGNPLKELKAKLRENNRDQFANEIDDYWLAINVLKHGAGRSLDQLLARRESLSSRVKALGEWFHAEGDLAEGQNPILIDDDFVLRVAEIVTEAANFSKAISRESRENKDYA